VWRGVVNISGVSIKTAVEEPLPRPEWCARFVVTISGELPGEVEEEEETLSERELEVELGAEAPAGSPLTLSEIGPLKLVVRLTMRSVRSGDAPHNSTNGWNAPMCYDNCVRFKALPSGCSTR